MKDIFTDLYNKVLGFFRQTEKKENAKDVACNRLRVVLMQDRTNLSPELMERMRTELIELLSKYVEMDKEALELNFEQEGSQMALMLSIPVLRAKEEAEIEKALAAEENSKKSAAKSEEDDRNETKEKEEVSEPEAEVSEDENDETLENTETPEEISQTDVEIKEEIKIVKSDLEIKE